MEGWAQLLNFVELRSSGLALISAGGNPAADDPRSFSMAVTEGGQLWTFGYGEDGQLGHGHEEGQLVPKVVALRG